MEMKLEELLQSCRENSLVCNEKASCLNDWVPELFIEKFKESIKDRIFCDVGCGMGGLTLSSSRFAKHSIGVDLINETDPLGWSFLNENSKSCYNKLLQHSKQEETNLTLSFGHDIFDLGIPDADFYILNLPRNVIQPAVNMIEMRNAVHCVAVIVPKYESYVDEELLKFFEDNDYHVKFFEKVCGFSRVLFYKDRSHETSIESMNWEKV